MTIRQFRKKPVVIEAYRLDNRITNEPPHWLYRAIDEGTVTVQRPPAELLMSIQTLEGTMTAREGEWIIKGVAGELYPCKPDIFEATYEAVTEAGSTECEAPMETLRPFLARRFLTHRRFCARVTAMQDCTCGLDAAIAKVTPPPVDQSPSG